MAMSCKMGTDLQFINGHVLDHGGCHPNMTKVLNNCHIIADVNTWCKANASSWMKTVKVS
eukprot:12814823-Ditylum_brightwellii.AAC.1